MMSAVNVHPSGRVGMVIGMSRSVHAAMKLNSATVLKPGPALGTAIRRQTPIGTASASILRAIITAATNNPLGRKMGKELIAQRTETKGCGGSGLTGRPHKPRVRCGCACRSASSRSQLVPGGD